MDEKHYKEDNWWISHYNFHPDVLDTLDLPDKVEIHDATLRDGEQTPGVVMSVEDKVAIAAKLDEIGIDRIEAGMPAVSTQDFEAIKKITSMGLNARIFTFARALKVDIDYAVDCGAHGVILEVPIGYPKLKYQFGWTWEDVLAKSTDVINYAKEKGLYVVFFPYDTTRARHDDLVNLLTGIVRDSSPDAVGLVDTMGCATPEAIQFMTRMIKKLTNLPVEIHTHNDFGMGVATELAALTAGAEVVHSCANGLGERTGNAALEDLIMNLQIMYGMDTDYNLSLLPELGELVASVSNIPIAPNKPVLGSRNFTRESGIGVDLVIKEPLAMFGTHPSLTGRRGDIVLGKKSGKASVIYNLEARGIEDYSEDHVAEILDKVKQRGIAKKSTLTDAEFDELVSTVLTI
jgi:isopropylmalate/homocitrate/citramalate synthase